MTILALDTATAVTTVALCGSKGPVLEARDDPPPGGRPGHARRLLPMTAELLDRARAGWEEVDRIAVGVGPGTFTGLRIGIATARGLARGRGIPLVAVSTLQSLALNAAAVVGGHAAPSVWRFDVALALLDARRGETFAAGWRVHGSAGGVETVLEPPLLKASVLGPEALGRAVEELGSSTLAIGEGALEFRGVLERSGALVPGDSSELHRVTAVNHCRLAGRLQASAPDEVRPEYLRLPDAEIARRPERKR